MVEWVEQMFRYNVPHGKLNRGLAVVAGVIGFETPDL